MARGRTAEGGLEGAAPASFCDALRLAYVEAPCEVLPNALWKTLARLEDLATQFTVVGGQVESIEMWASGELHPYWHRRRLPPQPSPAAAGHLRFALVHEAYADSACVAHLPRRSAYFRLRHGLTDVSTRELPDGCRFGEVNLPGDAADVSSLVADCYDSATVCPDTVRGWSTHPTYTPDLWLWSLDRDCRPVGLAIAELDPTVPEASLEWVQVLPSHRGRGIGSALVSELLRRMAGRAAFATVSGLINSPTQPEHMYRRCGFVGGDVWWVMQS